MKSLTERWVNIWNSIRQSKAQMPTRVAIPTDHIDEGERLRKAFKPNENYFEVRVNEMYLAYSREWFNKFDPMVFVVSEFVYGKDVETVPFVVGPIMMEKYGIKIPKEGMIFSDTKVAGLHPYKGGQLALSVILYRVQRENYGRKLLQMVESAANVFDFGTSLTAYVKVAGVVLDGVQALLELDGTVPIIGFRKEVSPAVEVFEPSYYALIHMPEAQLNINGLWVREHKLVYGRSLADAKPFRDADYVLYSINQTSERSDITTLPFYPLWERVTEEAQVAKANNWDSAKTNMASLCQTMSLSPDLTSRHAEKLADEYIIKMKALHERAQMLAGLGEPEAKPSELDGIRAKSLSILRL
ncbi:Uncharacterised protein [uncultured archaeon]|nr:Uncharacterised protein [uncultured archaeon]